MAILEFQARLGLGAAGALAGGAVALSLQYLSPSVARYLPDHGVFPAAVLGAGIAGMLLADGLGRAGWRGWGLTALSFVAMTVIGSGLGAEVIGIGQEGATGHIYQLGWMAILMGFGESPAMCLAWMAGLVTLHETGRRVRISP